MEVNETVSALQLYDLRTHQPAGFALFVLRDGYTYTDALTKRLEFDTVDAAMDFYAKAPRTSNLYSGLVRLA